jgi:rare lipoprotein A (peptidoglycan hydrolase)
MKRITATLLLIFISSLILNNFFAGITYNKVNTTIKVKTEEKDSTIVKVSKGKDTIVSKSSKPIINDAKKHHTATWYHTKPHPRVHREYPTAAYNFAPRGSKLLVRNIISGDSCIVEVTDRMGSNIKNHIDLSHMAFGILSKHSVGRIKVIVEQL